MGLKILFELSDIIKENNIKGIIIGNPINMDGSFGNLLNQSMMCQKQYQKKLIFQ